MCPIVRTLEKNKSEVVIAGGFNIDLKINDKKTFSEHFDMLTDNSFYLKFTLPTILLIDNLLCKLSEATLNTISRILTKSSLTIGHILHCFVDRIPILQTSFMKELFNQ